MYFDKPGKANTAQTLKLAFERARNLGIDEVVVASTHGDTAYQARDVFTNCKIIIVTYHCGFKEPFQTVMPPETRADLGHPCPIRRGALPGPKAWRHLSGLAHCRHLTPVRPGHQGRRGDRHHGSRRRCPYGTRHRDHRRHRPRGRQCPGPETGQSVRFVRYAHSGNHMQAQIVLSQNVLK